VRFESMPSQSSAKQLVNKSLTGEEDRLPLKRRGAPLVEWTSMVSFPVAIDDGEFLGQTLAEFLTIKAVGIIDVG
jgi:hypothetical protein